MTRSVRGWFLGWVCALSVCAAKASAAEDLDLAFFRNLPDSHNRAPGQPTAAQITPDGKAVIFLRSAPRDPVLRLFETDLGSGRERELLTPSQLLGSEGETLSPEEKARR